MQINVERIFSIMQPQCCKKRDSFLNVVQSVSSILKVRDTLELNHYLEHLNLADNITKSFIKGHLYNIDKCTFMKNAVESFKVLKMYVTEYDSKIQEAWLIKKLNPKLNKQLCAKGASFLRSIFYWYSSTYYYSVLTLNVLVLPFSVSFLLIVWLLTSHRNTPGYCCMVNLLWINSLTNFVPACWSSGNGFAEVQISGQSNRTQCCQWFATAAIFLRMELCCPQAQWRGNGPHKLVTRFGVIQRV